MTATHAPTKNAVHCIFPYRHRKDRSLWVFDDERFGLREEPFVLGASEAIERIVQRVCPGAERLRIFFSATPMPGAVELRRTWDGKAPELHGCCYHDGTDELWLCPAMAFYFPDQAPETIYLKVENATASPGPR